MAEHITVSRIIPARPERIFQAWLTPDEHTKMTGSFAQLDEDGTFWAWDGYITARTLEQRANSRIVQTWRTSEFKKGDPDSKLVVTLAPAEQGTLVTLEHTNIPDGQGAGYEGGWNDYYFDPMERYFLSPVAKMEEISDAVEAVMEEVENQLDAAAQKAIGAVQDARRGARRQALATVKRVKKASPKKASPKKASPKKASPKKASPKKASPKKAARKSKR